MDNLYISKSLKNKPLKSICTRKPFRVGARGFFNRAASVCLAILLLFSIAVRAEEEEDVFTDIFDEEEQMEEPAEAPPCSVAGAASLFNEVNDNIFVVGNTPTSDSIFKFGISGEMACSHSSRNATSISFGHARNEYTSNPLESNTASDVGFTFKTAAPGGFAQADFAFYDLDNATSSARADYAKREKNWKISYGLAFSDKTSAKAYYGHDRKIYTIYDTLNSSDEVHGAAFTYNFDNFSSVEMTYEESMSRYPNNMLIDKNSATTAVSRRDDMERVAVAVTKVFKLKPMSYAQATVENRDNSSNSTNLYVWFDADYNDSYKLVSNYDGYEDRNASLFYYREMGAKTALSLYYMKDTMDYANLFLINSDFSEPTIPQSSIMKYFLIDLTYKLKENWILDGAYTSIKNYSNDSLYTYSQKIYSIGLKVNLE